MMVFKKAFDVLKKKEMQQTSIQAAWICHIAQKEIDKVFKSADIFVFSFKEGNLNLKVENSIIAGEVRYQSDELKNNINQQLKKELVKRIRTKVG